MTRNILAAIVAAGFLASPVLAQPAETWNGLPDRFQIDTGYFRIDADATLRFNGPGGGGNDIDFESDLGVPAQVDTFWVDATWRVGRRHQLKLSYTRLDRERSDQTLQRSFEWGGQTFDAGLHATSNTGSEILGGYYRFAAFRNDRFEIGPTIGIGHLWVRAGIRATGTITGPGGNQESRTVEQEASTGSITGAVGGYAHAWPTKRLVVSADFLYIKVNPEDGEASVTDWRLGANYYFLRHAGLGVQYKYNNYSYDRGLLRSTLGGEVTFEGFQGFLPFLF